MAEQVALADAEPSSPAQPRQENQPSAVKRCFSPTVGWLQLAGWLMLGSLTLPLAEGCDGKVVSTYSTFFRSASTDSIASLGIAGSVMWIQCNLWLWSVVWMLVGVTRQVTIARALLRVQIGATLLALLAWILWLVATESPRELLQAFFGLGPVIVLAGWWLRSAHRRKDWPQLWSRVQHIWLLLAWLWVQIQCILVRKLLWGYFAFLIAMAFGVVAIEIARHRWQHDLLDSTAPVGRPQFSLRRTFAWVTGLALFIAYYQQIEILLGWLEER
jgi:hypothetical protein